VLVRERATRGEGVWAGGQGPRNGSLARRQSERIGCCRQRQSAVSGGVGLDGRGAEGPLRCQQQPIRSARLRPFAAAHALRASIVCAPLIADDAVSRVRPRVRSSDTRTSATPGCAFARVTHAQWWRPTARSLERRTHIGDVRLRVRSSSAHASRIAGRASGAQTMSARRAWAAAKGRRRAERIGPCWQRSAPPTLRPSRSTPPLTADWRCQQGPMRSDCRRARDPLRGPCPPTHVPSPRPSHTQKPGHRSDRAREQVKLNPPAAPRSCRGSPDAAGPLRARA